MIYSNAILSKILEIKEIRLLDALYNNLPENTLSERIYKLRKINGLSREDFANRIEVHITTVKAWENGCKTPTKTNLIKICSALGLNISELE